MKTTLLLLSLVLAATFPSAGLAGAVPCAPALPPSASQGSPVEAPPLSEEKEPEKADPMKLARASMDAMKAQLALLKSVKDKASADAAAPGWMKETKQLNDVTRTVALLDFDGLSYDEEAYMELVPQIFKVSEAVNVEFARLEKAGWYGSEALKQAIEFGNKPVLSDEKGTSSTVAMNARPLTPKQEKKELARMKSLVAPDKELRAELEKVVSLPTALAAIPALKAYVEKVASLPPDSAAVAGYFENADAPAVVAAYKPVKEQLELIRAELLRIVALDGFASKEFDPFNDAMDEVFQLLETTHDFWYFDIFDENFEDAIYDILNKEPDRVEKGSGKPDASAS